MKRILLTSVFILGAAVGVCVSPARLWAQPPAVGSLTPGRDESAAERRQRTFEIVWQTVRDKHYDPALNGVDWADVRRRYAPEVARLTTDEGLYPLLNRMLDELGQSHFGVIPPAAVLEEAHPGQPGDLGLEVRVLDDQVVITEVTPGSVAEREGLRPGFAITAIDGKAIEALKVKIGQQKSPAKARFALMRGTMAWLAGPVGSVTNVSVLDADNRPREVSVRRQPLGGEPVKFGNLPVSYQQFEARRLPGGVGYIKFNIFLMPILAQAQSAMKDFKGAPGIVIDLRGNPGGIGGLAAALARHFHKGQSLLGTMKLRAGEQRFVVFPNPDAYEGPLVILTDEASASTSEILAGGMQESGRALVVGQNTAGAVLPSNLVKLPTGAVLQYAVADFKTPGGKLLEGVGVRPDYEVRLTRGNLLEGRDVVLEKALALIAERRNK